MKPDVFDCAVCTEGDEAVDHPSMIAAIVGGATGILASLLTALGIRDRIDKIERNLVGTATFQATCESLTARIASVQIDLDHQMQAMRTAALAAENAAQAARVAAERAVELARQYVEYRENEAKEWRLRMDEKIAELMAHNSAARAKTGHK